MPAVTLRFVSEETKKRRLRFLKSKRFLCSRRDALPRHIERRASTASMGDSEFDYSSEEYGGKTNTTGRKVRGVSALR